MFRCLDAVELLPVHCFADEPALTARGLRNYWGYNSIGFFAPHTRYGSAEEFRVMVDRLHEAGLLVIPSGTHALRWLPPLNVTRAQIDEAAAILAKTLA